LRGSAAVSAERGGLVARLKATLHEWRLTLQRVRKPDPEEYIQASKIIWLAIFIVGAVAYTIHLAATLVLG